MLKCKSILISIFYFSLTTIPIQAKDKLSYLFILDASGSMNDRMNGATRMEIATKELENFIKSLPDDAELGLVAYGNKIPGCNSARLYSPLKKNNKKDILAKLPLFFPAGSTPIARTLELVNQHLLSQNQKTEIILISDGIESCDGEPSLEMRKIQKQYPGTILHVLAIDVPKNEEPELQTLSKIGGGKYFNVKDHQSLKMALKSIQGIPDEPSMFSELQEPKNDAPISTKSPTYPYIKIQSIEIVQDENSMKEIKIHYEFKALPIEKPGDYSALIFFFPENTNLSQPSPEKIPNRFSHLESIVYSRSVAHSSSEGTGFIWVQLKGNTSWKISCELWDMNTIPKPIAVGNIKNLKDEKKTENFPKIFR